MLRTRKRGFTLFEMVMVLALLACGAMIAVPNWINILQSWDIETAMTSLVTKIREVQQNAIMEQKNYQIVFDSVADTYKVEREGNMTYNLVEGPESFEHGIQVSTDIMIPMADTLRFDQFGVPAKGGGIFLTDSAGGSGTNLFVADVTGRIKIQ